MPETDRPWWHPDRHADRRPALRARGRILSALRGWFDLQGFVEVDPGAVQISPGNETHLHAFATQAIGPDGGSRPLYLHTSPEFAMKKLLAAGERRIVALSHVWRNRERGALHAPEFALLEWYRAETGYEALMEDCMAILRLAARAADTAQLTFRDRQCDPFAPPERLSVTEAFARHAGIDLAATLAPTGTGARDALAGQVTAAGLRVSADDSWSDLFSRVLTDRVEPRLGLGRATILDLYPLPEAALARPSATDPRLAERFELYACGVELANGFGELTDAAEQRRRFEADMAEKARLYDESYPLDEGFLAALDHMPEAAGIALGFDRLVMLATGAPRIDDVIWTPFP